MTDEGQPKIAYVGHEDDKEDRQRYWAPELFRNQTYSQVNFWIKLSKCRSTFRTQVWKIVKNLVQLSDKIDFFILKFLRV